MKVLQIINSHSEAVGGAERLALELHRGALARGVDAHLLCLMKAPASRADKTYSLGFASPYHPAVLGRLVRFLRQPRWRDVDAIHVHLFPAQPLVALAARLAGLRVPLVTTEHNTFNRRRALPGARMFDRFYYRFYERIVCISEGTREAMQAYLPELSPKLRTIFNGIDLSRFGAKRAAKTNGEPLVVLSAGRLTEQKNYEAALEAMSELNGLPFEYWIAGHGELEAQLKNRARALGLDERVRFLGFRADLPRLLGEADVFLSSSKWEGFGLSVVEAMAAGLPVVVSNIPGVAEVVGREPKCGLFAAPSSPSDIADKLRSLLTDPRAREELGSNARKRAALFDVSRMVDDYVRLYSEVSR